MYSFAQRAEILVIDEPLYGHYLRATGAELLSAMESCIVRTINDAAAGEVTLRLQRLHHEYAFEHGTPLLF